MSDVIECTSTQCRYNQNGKWMSSMEVNPIRIGTNLTGTYKYVGQWEMPPIKKYLNEIKSIRLHIYRNSYASERTREYYIGCSTDVTDATAVLSTGITFSLGWDAGWQTIDVSGLAEYIAGYESIWYLLIGNPDKTDTYAEIAGYNSGKMLYLEIECSNGSKIYLASNGELVPYQIYHAEDGELVRYDLYHAEDDELVKY